MSDIICAQKEIMCLCENVLGIYISGERWLGRADPTGQSGARFLPKVTLPVCAPPAVGGYRVPASWQCHPAACTCCHTHRCDDISLFYFLFLWLPLKLSISLNTCLLFGFSCKLLVHILGLFFCWS